MTVQRNRLISPITLFIVVVGFMVFKYWYDHRPAPTPESQAVFEQLEQTMEQRLAGIPENVKRRINITDLQYSYSPHQASYRVMMHVSELFSGTAIAQISQDCDHWYEEFAVQLKPSQRNSMVLFDYEAQRMESLTSRRAEVSSRTKIWEDGKEEVILENLSFQKIGATLELRSEGESHMLDPDTKLNIESGLYLLNQIEQKNWQLEYLSEPDEFSEFPIQNKVTIEPYQKDRLLENLWLIKSEAFKHNGVSYQRATTVLELINDRAVTLYAATIDVDGILYELILGDFEYRTTRCQQFASL